MSLSELTPIIFNMEFTHLGRMPPIKVNICINSINNLTFEKNFSWNRLVNYLQHNCLSLDAHKKTKPITKIQCNNLTLYFLDRASKTDCSVNKYSFNRIRID